MKKIILFFAIIILIGVGGYFIYNNYLPKNENTIKKDNDTVEEVSDDLFGKYYGKATKIIDDMTLEEKVGQLFLVRYDGNLANTYISKYNAGGFLLFARDFDGKTKSIIKEEIDGKQKLSKIGLAIGVDEEGGYVTRVSRFKALRDEKFTSPKSYYETGGYPLVEQMENEKATLLKSLGVNLNLAPVADISTNPDDFMYIRSFGGTAEETSTFIKNMVGYAKNNNISSCLKHFPGYGNNVDTHTGVAIDTRSYDTFTTSDYLPFISGINEGVPFVLVSHNVVTSMDDIFPASLSNKIITGELRDKLNFTGIIITDDLDMDAVKAYAEGGNAATLAINAGADMLITSDYVNMYNEIITNINNGIIKEETIDMAVKRIISWKLAYEII
ncbi:MAG: glycoside hydrolase family 3 N-terminal domain-containing protein [Bacilli bacterium]|nr:glycoside hydrolase family 3 N-terminal domain-containing protein [Bacilli bacterium]